MEMLRQIEKPHPLAVISVHWQWNINF